MDINKKLKENLCDGCPDSLNCLIRESYSYAVETCPCQECIIKVICENACKNRRNWSWFNSDNAVVLGPPSNEIEKVVLKNKISIKG